MKKLNKQNKIVEITWRDSNVYPRQDSRQYAIENFKMAVFHTVGYLIRETKTDYLVSREFEEEENDVRGSIVIPKENVVKVKRIK